MSTIRVGRTQVDYLEQGSGEPVLLLHCSASSSAQWRALVARLSERYRVIAPDLLGYGGTAPWCGAGAFRLAHEARIVCALLGRAGAPAHLLGHSYGGAVALHVARTRPDLLSSLTLIEPVAFHLLRGLDEAALAEIVQVSRGVEDALAAGDTVRGIARFVDYWSGPGTWETIPQDRRGGLCACLGKIALDFHATINEPVSLADFADMALPTLVLQGACSPRPRGESASSSRRRCPMHRSGRLRARATCCR